MKLTAKGLGRKGRNRLINAKSKALIPKTIIEERIYMSQGPGTFSTSNVSDDLMCPSDSKVL